MWPKRLFKFNFNLGYAISSNGNFYLLDKSVVDKSLRCEIMKSMSEDFRNERGNPNLKFEHYPNTNL
jgi:hypothetical protein